LVNSPNAVDGCGGGGAGKPHSTKVKCVVKGEETV
jgi:hypothetical protein